MTIYEFAKPLIKANKIIITNNNCETIYIFANDDELWIKALKNKRFSKREIRWISLEKDYLEIRVQGK